MFSRSSRASASATSCKSSTSLVRWPISSLAPSISLRGSSEMPSEMESSRHRSAVSGVLSSCTTSCTRFLRSALLIFELGSHRIEALAQFGDLVRPSNAYPPRQVPHGKFARSLAEFLDGSDNSSTSVSKWLATRRQPPVLLPEAASDPQIREKLSPAAQVSPSGMGNT